jgi:serine/threonine protein kinase
MFLNRVKSTASIVMDLAEGESLMELMHKNPNGLPLGQVEKLSEQLIKAVSYLHSKGVCHRDINPNNIIIQQSYSPDISLKLIDFNTARFFEKKDQVLEEAPVRLRMTTKTGFLKYRAP